MKNYRICETMVFKTILTLSLLLGALPIFAATAPSLGTLSPYAIVSSTFTNSNTSPQTIINGDRCDTTPPVTAPLTTTGTITTGGCNPTTGTDQSSALNNVTDGLNTQACTAITGTLDAVIIGVNAAGTFPPGCYAVTGAMNITSGTTVTLDATATGGSGSVWIFKSSGALTTGASTAGFPSVALANGATASDVFWAPVGATTLGANFALSVTPTFVGNILDAAGISLGHFANLSGRALAFGGTVTTDANTITVPGVSTTATLKVIKVVTNNSGGASIPGDWTLTVTSSNGGSGTGSAVGASSPGTSYTIQAGKAYAVAESGGPAGYTASASSDCAIASAVVDTTYTCTITNNDTPAHLIVIKHMVNNDTGSSLASAYSTTISGVTTATPTASGAEAPGVDNTLTTVGAYTVDEGAHVGYNKTLSAGCTGTIALGETKTCTITNDDITPPTIAGGISMGTINVVKVVVNDSGRTKVVADFPLFVNGAPVISGATNSFAASGVPYTVTETRNSNYTQKFSGDCNADGKVSVNGTENKFCIITNDDIAGVIATTTPVVPPLIEILKTASPLALPLGAGPVTYTYTLRNIGTVPMSNITMVGDTCSPIALASGDTNSDTKLDVSETWIYRCSTSLAKTHTNTIVATGWANGISAVDIASATVVVGLKNVPPLIHVVKVPSTFTLPATGGAVTYTYTVTNPGTAPLSNVNISDDKCTGLPGRVVGHPGDLNKNDLLESDEIWKFTCNTNLTKTTTNIATAEGTANGIIARDFSIATVVVTAPGFPNTGIPLENNNIIWGVIILAAVVVISLLFNASRKAKNV